MKPKWKVFKIVPETAWPEVVDRDLDAGSAVIRSNQLNSQPHVHGVSYAPGISKPNRELAVQEVTEEMFWRAKGCPRQRDE